jgi:hypothetical protein
MPITLTLKQGGHEVNFPNQATDASGFFTAPVGNLPLGTYAWRVKGPQYLANSGSVSLDGASFTHADMGLMLTGDASDDNVVDVSDFSILKATFGKGAGDPGYDARADFNCDQLVEIGDFNLLKINFGKMGAPPVAPERR